MFFKCFNLSFSPSPNSNPRASRKERIQGKWTYLERIFGVTLSVLSGNQCLVHRLAAVSPSILQHFRDALAVWFGRVGRANTISSVAVPSRDSQASALAPLSRRDPEPCQEKFSAVSLSRKQRSAKTWDPRAHSTGKSSSAESGSAESCLHSPDITHLPQVLPQHVSCLRVCLSQLTSLCQSAWVC